MRIFRALVSWRKSRRVDTVMPSRDPYGQALALAERQRAIRRRLDVRPQPLAEPVSPVPVDREEADQQAWQWVPAAPAKVGRHRRAEPVPEFGDRPVPDIGSTEWWLWRGARLIAERHHEHPHRPGVCAFCPPDAAWPCAAVDLAYRAEEMSRRLGPEPKRAGCRYPCCAPEPAGAGTR